MAARLPIQDLLSVSARQTVDLKRLRTTGCTLLLSNRDGPSENWPYYTSTLDPERESQASSWGAKVRGR